MPESEVDISQLSGSLAPDRVKEQYLSILPKVLAGNPDLSSNQDAIERIQALQLERRTKLFGVVLSEEATPLQEMVFNRKLLKLKSELHITSSDEDQALNTIESTLSDSSEKLSGIRDISLAEADDILMKVFNFNGITSVDDALERLTKGPKINGFGDSELPEFNFSNDEIRKVLESSFGIDAILDSRLIEISKVPGFPIQCTDVELGNRYVYEHEAKWHGGFLVLPDRKTYEDLAMIIEGVSNPEELQHTFKLRAAADTSGGFGAVKILELVVEQPSHFDYLSDLEMSDKEKMQAYFLGLVAHEAVHPMQAFSIKENSQDEYRAIVTQEKGSDVGREYVSQYVDRHKTNYGSNEKTIADEDLAESIRIFLTNSAFLKRNFPRRYAFIRQNLSFVNENAIRDFVNEKGEEPQSAE